MKKILMGLVAAVTLVLGAAVVVPGMIDWEQHKPKIQTAIHDATGYNVRFGGPVKLAILPFPHVSLETFVISVPEETTSGEPLEIVTLKKAEVSVALAPLFRGEVSVNSINLVDPVIRLDINREGRKLWMTDVLQAKAAPEKRTAPSKAAAGQEAKLALEKIEIENGSFFYNDASTGTQQEIRNINAMLSANSLSGPFKGTGDLVWNAQKINFDIQSGRMDKVAQTISVQAKARIPANGADFSYSGVVGTAGLLDLQGETSFETDNLSGTLAGLTGKPSALAPLPFRVRGLLTAKPEQAGLKTMQLTFGGLNADGSVGVSNLQGKNGPMQVNAVLKSGSVFNLEDLMPLKSVKTVRATANADAPRVGGIKSFLPQTLHLPAPMDIKADVALAGMFYKGTEFGDVKIILDKKGSAFYITETIGKMPGGGTLTARSDLAFASGSQGTRKSGVVYSDPTLTYDLRGDARAPGKFLSAFLPESTIKSMQPLFKDPIGLSAKGRIQTSKVAVDSGSVSLGKTAFNLGASSYTVDPAGRDDVLLTLTGQDINLDHFAGKKTESPTEDKVQTPTVAPKPASAALGESLKKLNLPVDLTLKTDLKNVTMQGITYGAMKVDGSLNGGVLDLRSVSLTDQEGDVMQASGIIKDVQNLAGIDMTLGGKTGDAISFLSSFKVDTSKLPRDFGPLDLSVSLTGEKPESLAFDANARALGGEGQASGLLLNALAAKPAVDKLSLHVTHPNFEQLAQKFNPSYKAGVGIKKDMDVYANINLEGDTYSISGLKAIVAGMDMTGTIKAKTGGTKPDVTANLVAGTIPLDILSGKNRTAKTSVTAAKVTTTSSNDVRWSRNAMNTALLHAFNLDLKINAKRVEYGNWMLDDTILAMTIKDGVMSIGQMDAKVYGGTMGLTANVKSSDRDREPLTFTVKSDFKDVGLEQLASSFSGAKVVKARGNVTVGLEASSTGISPAALISALNGKGTIDGRNVVIEGFDLAAMSRSLVSTTKVVDNIAGLAGAAFSGGETAFDKVEGPFTITEGVINFDNLAMTGATANITNKGQISLPRWFIDMNSTIDLAMPEEVPNLDIRFQGPLDNPGNTFAGNAMESYVNTRVNQKLQKVLGDKLGDKNPELNTLLNSVLGGGNAPAPAPAGAPEPAIQEQQIAPSSGDTTAPAPAQKQLSPEEQIMKGVLEGLMGQ